MTTNPTANGLGDVIDLTPNAAELRPKRFRVGPHDDDVFTAAASVPVFVAVEGMRILQGDAGGDEASQAERAVAFLDTVIFPEDLDRWHARLRDLRRPVDHRVLFRTLDRLMEEWGLRPTEPPPRSSDGEPPADAGTSSTAAPPPAASTSPASPSPAS